MNEFPHINYLEKLATSQIREKFFRLGCLALWAQRAQRAEFKIPSLWPGPGNPGNEENNKQMSVR